MITLLFNKLIQSPEALRIILQRGRRAGGPGKVSGPWKGRRSQRASPGNWPPRGHWDRGLRGMTLLSQPPRASENAGQSHVIAKLRRELGDLDGVLGDPADAMPSGQSQRRTPHTNRHRHCCSVRHTDGEGGRALPAHAHTVHRCVLR